MIPPYFNDSFLDVDADTREAIAHLVDGVQTNSSRATVEALVVYLANAIVYNRCQPTPINAKWVLKHFKGLNISALVKAGLLRRVEGYRKGWRSFGYVMGQPLHDLWLKGWTRAVAAPKSTIARLQAPSHQQEPLEATASPCEPLEWPSWRNMLRTEIDDVPLTQCFSWLHNDEVATLVSRYLEQLRDSLMPFRPEALAETIRHGTELVEKNETGSRQHAQGIAYLLAAKNMKVSSENGCFKPRYTKSEGRVFEHGFQQLPKEWNKADFLTPGSINIDMRGAHVRICREIMQKLGMNTTPLDEFLLDKKALAGKLGLKAEVLKVAVLALLNGASLGQYDDSGKPLTIFNAFLEEYGTGGDVLDYWATFVTWARELRRNCAIISFQASDMGASRRKEVNVGLISNVIEFVHKAICIVDNGLTIQNDQHDGAVVSHPDPTWTMEKFSTSKADALLGISIVYEEKLIGGSRMKTPDNDGLRQLAPSRAKILNRATAPHCRSAEPYHYGMNHDQLITQGDTQCQQIQGQTLKRSSTGAVTNEKGSSSAIQGQYSCTSLGCQQVVRAMRSCCEDTQEEDDPGAQDHPHVLTRRIRA